MAATLVAQSSQPAFLAAFDLEELTIDGLQQRMTSGRETARSLAEKYLARIEAVDRHGPMLRSVIEINPDALSIADRRSRRTSTSTWRGSDRRRPCTR